MSVVVIEVSVTGVLIRLFRRVLKKTATEDEIVNLVVGSSQESGRQLRRSVRANR